MKTTVEISDTLLVRAKRHAKQTGQPLRALIEEGLRRVLAHQEQAVGYRLPDCAVGTPGGENPLEQMAWSDLRDEIYGTSR